MDTICLVIGQGNRLSENIFSTRNSLCSGPFMTEKALWRECREEKVEMQNEANSVGRGR